VGGGGWFERKKLFSVIMRAGNPNTATTQYLDERTVDG
jgi:hypothetical protein